MASFIKVFAIGNLTKDPDLRSTQSGKTVCGFTIAVNDGYGENKTVQFWDVTAWGKTAEICKQYISKGSTVCITGKITEEKFTNRDGVEVAKKKIVADDVQFLSTTRKRNDDREEEPPPRRQRPRRDFDEDVVPPVRNQKPPAPYSGDEFPEPAPF